MGAGTVLWGSSPAVARGKLVFVGKEELCWGRRNYVGEPCLELAILDCAHSSPSCIHMDASSQFAEST